jgi:hypothetical protein
MNSKKYEGKPATYLVGVSNPLVGDRKIPISCEEWASQVDLVAEWYGAKRVNKDADSKDKPELLYSIGSERDAILARKDIKLKGLSEKVFVAKKEDGDITLL